MSIASELSALNGYILDAYDEVNTKGGAVPANKNMTNLATAISSISGGGSGVDIPREVDSNGTIKWPTQPFTYTSPANATSIGAGTYYNAFYECPTLTSVDFSSVVRITGKNAFTWGFYNCAALTAANFSSLATVDNANSAFNSAFRYCSSLASVNFSSLASMKASGVFSNTFYNCSSLTTLSFPSLTTTSFGSIKDQFNGMLSGCSGVTVHFPSAIQSTIGNWSSVTSGFGGTNTTVLFDL